MRKVKQIVVETAGSEIAEAALVLPIVFMILMGILWFGRAYNVYATITHAAQEGARLAATNDCATCGNNSFQGNSGPVVTAISQALQASKLDPTKVTSPSPTPTFCTCGNQSCGTPVSCAPVSGGQPQVCIQFNVQLDPNVVAPGSCGVAVSFQYPYQFYFPFTSLNLQQINLNAQVRMKGEY
jgi:Flp pilus assembly protein TadG